MSFPALDLQFRFNQADNQHELVAAALLDFDAAAVHEISAHQWRVFFRSTEARDSAARVLSETCEVTPLEIEDEDWARRSQEDLKAIQVGSLVIAPPWDIPSTGEESERGRQREAGTWQLITIEPSTGFGTGHHATTRLCLRALQAIDLRGKRVLDVGTGSGVLAIAAAKLGAASVIAVDNDPDAIAAASENVERNSARVEVRLLDLERTQPPDADVVLANLTGATLQRSAGTLAALAPRGVLIVSGLLDEEGAVVSGAFAPYAALIESTSEAGWVSLVVRLA